MAGLPQRSDLPPVAREPATPEHLGNPPARSLLLAFPWRRRAHPRRPAPRDPDDYTLSRRQLIGFAVFFVLFIAFGVWLLEAMRAQMKLEECLMAGRKNCAPISVALPER